MFAVFHHGSILDDKNLTSYQFFLDEMWMLEFLFPIKIFTPTKQWVNQ